MGEKESVENNLILGIETPDTATRFKELSTRLRELNGTTISGPGSGCLPRLLILDAEVGLMSSKVPFQSESMMRSIVGQGYTCKRDVG